MEILYVLAACWHLSAGAGFPASNMCYPQKSRLIYATSAQCEAALKRAMATAVDPKHVWYECFRASVPVVTFSK
jgi:hypothetical protein